MRYLEIIENNISRRAAILGASLAFFPKLSHSEERTVSVSDEKDTIKVFGVLSDSTAKEFIAAIQYTYPHWNEKKSLTILFNSEGGKTFVGLQLAHAMAILKTKYHVKITTVVVNGGLCASACIIPFSAGDKRIMEPESELGLHAVHNNNGGQDGVNVPEAEDKYITAISAVDAKFAQNVFKMIKSTKVTFLSKDQVKEISNNYLN